MRLISLFLIPLFTLIYNPSFSQNSSNSKKLSLKNKNILIVYGGWKGHQPDVFAKKILTWIQGKGGNVHLSDSLGVYTQKSFMKSIDLIIQFWTMGEISDEQSNGLLDAVKSGTGIFGFHGGTGDSFRNNTSYQYMIGGQFVSHPGGQANYSVQFSATQDPLIDGLADFEIKKTEQYYMHVDPNIKVLATTTFTGKYDSWIKGAVVPVVWKKYFDKGRVFYMSIGHNPEDLDHPTVWTLLTRGIYWAAASKYDEREEWVSPVYKK